MKKTHSITSILSSAQLFQLYMLAKKHPKSMSCYSLMLTPQWKLKIKQQTIELELVDPPIINSKIVRINHPIIPSLKKIHQCDKECKLYRISQKDSFLLKIVTFLNVIVGQLKEFIMKDTYYGEKIIQIDLEVLGYFRFCRFEIDYFNSKGILKWFLATCEQPRIKLHELMKGEGNQKISKKFLKSQSQQKLRAGSQIGRKFSLSSFKQYSIQKKKPLDVKRERIKSLPSLDYDQIKSNHKQIRQKVESIKQKSNVNQANKRVNYLKIQRRQPKKQNRLKSLLKQQKQLQEEQQLNEFQQTQKLLTQKEVRQKQLRFSQTSYQAKNQKQSIKDFSQINEEGSRQKSFKTQIQLAAVISTKNVRNSQGNETSSFSQSSMEYSISKPSINDSSQKTQKSHQQVQRRNLKRPSVQAKRTNQFRRMSTKINGNQNLRQTTQKRITLQKSKKQSQSFIQSENKRKENENCIKQTIKRLLKSNPELASNKNLIDQACLIYLEQQLHSQMFRKSEKTQTFVQLQHRHQRNKQLEEKLNIKISQCHRRTNLTKIIIPQILQKFNILFNQRVYDPSQQIQIQLIRKLFQNFQLHTQGIKNQIESIFEQEINNLKKQREIKSKFLHYKFHQTYTKKQKPLIKQGTFVNFYDFKTDEPENQFALEQERVMRNTMKKFHDEQKQQYHNFYHVNYYMPYYYIFSQNLAALFSKFFQVMSNTNNEIVIELKTVNSLRATVDQHLQQIANLYDKFMEFYQFIPLKIFHIHESEVEEIKKLIGIRTIQIKQCENVWEIALNSNYKSFEEHLQQFNERVTKNSQCTQKDDKNLQLKQKQQLLQQISLKLANLNEVKTYIRYGKYILDTNMAKITLINGYQICISNLYQNATKILNHIFMQWSQEMAKSERLLTEQLVEEQAQIGMRIKYLAKDYIGFTKFIFLNRSSFFLNQNMQDSENIIFSKLKSKKLSSEQNTQKANQNLAKEQFGDKFIKSLNYCYNMNKKNKEKLQQISYLILKYKQRIVIVSKSIESKQKQLKAQYMEISSQMRSMIKDIRNKSDLMKMEQKIRQMETYHKNYKQVLKKLQEQMAKNNIIVWQEDDYLENNVNICLKVINFLASELYMRVNFHTIDTIRFQHFYKYYKMLEKLMNVLEGHKFQEFFISDYQLSTQQIQAVQMILYKDYTFLEIQQIRIQCSLDLRPSLTSTKIYEAIKQLRVKPLSFKEISTIYKNRKKQKYSKAMQKGLKIDIELSQRKENEIIRIINYQQLVITFEDQINNNCFQMSQIQRESRERQLWNMNKMVEISHIIAEYETILKEMDLDIKEDEYVSMVMFLEKFKLCYHNCLHRFKQNRSFCVEQLAPQSKANDFQEKQWKKLLLMISEIENFKLKNRFYWYLSKECHRFLMIPYSQLISLMDWRSQYSILRNIKILFREVVDIEFGHSNSIIALYVSRGISNDRLQISSGPIDIDRFDKYGKLVRHIENQVRKSLLLMVPNCIGRVGQMKILHWHLYFTEQVQQQIITNSSLKSLQARMQDTISQIKYDLRYDIKNHKDQQICQLNTFIHYIRDYLGQFPQIDSFEWMSTIRAYEKNKCVMIQQNSLEFYYGFEPKSVQVLTSMNWNMGLSVSYGDSTMENFYQYKAYILGAPYFQFSIFKDSFLSQQKNIQKFIQTIQTNSFICSICQPSKKQEQYLHIFNQIHKEIMHYLNTKSKIGCIDYQYDSIKEDNTLHSSGKHIGSNQKRKDIENAQNEEGEEEVNIKPRKNKRVLTVASHESHNDRNEAFINVKGRLSVLLCYPNYETIPPCFLKIYRCRNPTQFQPDTLPLKINLLLELSSMDSQLKSKLIWKLIKLTKALIAIQTITIEQLTKIVVKIINIIERKESIDKEIKNEIYCCVVESFVNEYAAVAQIVNQVFKLQDLIELDLQKAEQTPSDKFIDLALSRQQLVDQLQLKYKEICTSNKDKKVIVVYGEEPSCKTTFITQRLGLKLSQNEGYIESVLAPCFSKDQQILKSQYYHPSTPQNYPYNVIQAGRLSQIQPSMLGKCLFLYVPTIPKENNQLYMKQLKQYFCLKILKHESVICTIPLLDKLWHILTQFYFSYQELNSKGSLQISSINIYIDYVLQLYTIFLKKVEINESKPEHEVEQDRQIDIRQKSQLFTTICFETLYYRLPKQERKFFIEALKDKQTKQDKIKGIKVQQLETMTYTPAGELIKYDSNCIGPKNMTIIKKQMVFLCNLMSKQLMLINKFVTIGANVNVCGNSRHMFEQISQFVRNGQEGHCFVLDVKVQNFRHVYGKVEEIYQRKRATCSITRAMVSGKIMEISTSRANISQRSQRKIENIRHSTLIIVDDMHLSSEYNVAQLAAYLSRSNNMNYGGYDDPQIEKFLLYRNSRYEVTNTNSVRLRRHLQQVYLPDLQLTHVYKFRQSFMLNQQQANLTADLFKLNLFNSSSNSAQWPDKFYSLQLHNQIIKFAIETTCKMPSQFYSKFLLFKLYFFMLGASMYNYNRHQYRPGVCVDELIRSLQGSASMIALADKITGKKYNSFYILQKEDKFIEIDHKKVQTQIEQYIQLLPFERQQISRILSQYLPLLLASKSLIIKEDHYRILPSLCSLITNRKQKSLTHNFIKQIAGMLSELVKNKEVYITFNVPEYLLHHRDFVKVFVSFVEGKEIFVENQEMFTYWWESVLEYEYIHNKCQQYREVKEMLEQAIRRTNFIIHLSQLTLLQALEIITSNEKTGNDWHGQSVTSALQLKTQNELLKSSMKTKLDLEQPNKKDTGLILQPNFKKFQLHLKEKKNHAKLATDKLNVLNNLVLLNLELKLQEKLQIMNKTTDYYIQIFNVPTELQSYVQNCIEFLKIVLMSQGSQSDQDLSSESDENSAQRQQQNKKINEQIFYCILQTIPKLMKRLTKNLVNIKNKKSNANINADTMNLIMDQQKTSTIDLIENINNKIAYYKNYKKEIKEQLQCFRSCIKNLSSQLTSKFKGPQSEIKIESIDQFYKYESETGDQEEQEKMSQIEKYGKLKKEYYINSQLSDLKRQFLQKRATFQPQVQLKCQIESQNIDLIKNCFRISVPFSSEGQGVDKYHKLDYIIEQRDNGSRLIDYLVVNMSFVRFSGINQQFVSIAKGISIYQYQQILLKLVSFSETIKNYSSLKACLQYLSKISIIFSNDESQKSTSLKQNDYFDQQQRKNEQKRVKMLILHEYKFVQYIMLLDSLEICNNTINSLAGKLQNAEKVDTGLAQCVNFLIEIGNYKLNDPPSTDNSEKELSYSKNFDRQVKLQIFEIITNEVLSKIANNVKFYYELHQRLDLQNGRSILFALDHPRLMYPWKWQQIQYQIFGPLTQNPYQLMNQKQNENVKPKLNMVPHRRLSIFNSASIPRRLTPQNTCKTSQLKINTSQGHLRPESLSNQSLNFNRVVKYAIVYDPYSELIKYIQSGCQSINSFYRKIVQLKNQKNGFCESLENNEKLSKLNPVPTFYLFYFKLNKQKVQQSYKESLQCLNSILNVLRSKDQKGQSQNDRLIVIVHHKYLCEDIRRNAQFSNHALNQETPQQTSIPEIIIVSLELTQINIVQYFREISEENKLMNKNTILNLRQKQSKKQQLVAKSGLIHISNSNSLKSLESLHSEYSACKNYIKILIKNLVTTNFNGYSPLIPFQISENQLNVVMKGLQDFQARKSELLNQYCQQKLLNYQYFLDEDNLTAINYINDTLMYMMRNQMIPMDFIASIGNYTTIQYLIENCNKVQTQKQMKSASKTKSIFFKSRPRINTAKPEKKLARIFQTVAKLFQQYKTILTNRIYCANRNNSGNSPSKERILSTLLSPYEVLVLIYENIESWVITQLLKMSIKGKFKLIFDQKIDCFEFYMDLALSLNKTNRKIVFIAHKQRLQSIADVIHATKIFWI